MAKKNKGDSSNKGPAKSENQKIIMKDREPSVLFSMSHAPSLDSPNQSIFGLFPAIIFTAFIVMITRMHTYERPMGQFFWSGGDASLTDFFSYFKMVGVFVCAILALVMILYKVVTQSLVIKKSFVYIPMAIYSLLVVLSYAVSDYKEFTLWGWNDRFEGTITLLCYMVMLFYIINFVNTEKQIKWIIYPLAISSAVLGLLGVTQALDHDFFRTAIGKKLITPSWFWDQVDGLNFTFQNKEIYQTVYNINYVSFYLTLLIPLFGLLFIKSIVAGKEEALWKKLLWGVLFALLIFNLIGSQSSGGLMGMAVVVVVALIVLNKRIIQWWKPVAALVVITLIVGGTTYERWAPELFGAINSVSGKQLLTVPAQNKVPGHTNAPETITEETAALPVKHYIDYIETKGNEIIISIEGNEMTLTTFPDEPIAIEATSSEGQDINLVPTEVSPVYRFDHENFSMCTIQPAEDEAGYHYFILTTDGNPWPFRLTEEGPLYLNGMGALIDLHKVPAIGWESNQSFGSGRGYIWSRTLPMMKETFFLGHGADSYTMYFPHDDYIGKYNANWNLNLIVDKPHNMYMGMAIGTGGVSLLIFFVLVGFYILQSLGVFLKRKLKTWYDFTGIGIFLGVCGFLAAGLVNDSTISVMPMFYGLLGIGISCNIMLKSTPSSAE